MMEMTEAAAILSASTPNSLVLMDEIGRGTSTYDGLALAWAIACRLLTHNRALTLFATHYFELTRLPSEQPSAANVHLAAAESAGGIVFLHEVREGPASRSYGIQVAQRAGVPAAVIRQATRELERLESQGAPAAARPVRRRGRRRRAGRCRRRTLRRPRGAGCAARRTRRHRSRQPDLARSAGRPLPSQEASAMNLDHPLPLLGNQSPNDFMRRYWQKKPLLIRQAIPGFAASPSPRSRSWRAATTWNRA